MVFEGSFGSLAAAIDAAGEVEELAHGLRHPIARTVMLRRAACTYRRSGDCDRVRSIIAQVLELSKSMRLPSQSIPALERLADVALDEGDFDETHAVLREMRKLATEAPGLYTNGAVFSVEARLLLETSDVSVISEVSHAMLALDPTLPQRRGQQSLLASRAALLCSLGPLSLLPDTTRRLRELHDVFLGLAEQDYPVAALCSSLLALDRNADAAKLLQDYLENGRRDRGPLPPSLRRLTNSLRKTTE
jgi:hypothetical protein